VIPRARLARMRLAAQRLTPATAAAVAVEAARAVIGIQAQDVRASGLALRSRVPGITRSDINSDPALVRTWTVRGTVHLLAADDLPWVHALTGPRNQRRFDALMAKRGNLETARSILPALIANLEDGPLSRADLLTRLAEQGQPSLGPRSVNIAMPWAAASGRVIGLPDGRFRATDPPAPIDEDEALTTLGRRYLEGYGPAGAADLARWSGLPLSLARRALDACEGTERHGDLLAPAGPLDTEPPPAPPALLLAAYDTSMLGWRSREPLVATADDGNVLPGGGVVRAVVLARGRATGTWRLEGSGKRRRATIDLFGRAPAAAALRAELADVGRFLGLDLDLAA
jgi:hypothetical protein